MMWDCFLHWLYEMVAALWKADSRPEARRFTLGCAAVVLAVAIGIALLYR